MHVKFSEGGDMVLFIFVAPFLGFNAQEGQAEEKSQQQHFYLKLAITKLCRADRHRHGQAAANQHGGVKGTDRKGEAPAGSCEHWEIPAAIDQVSAEHSPEEHDFRA